MPATASTTRRAANRRLLWTAVAMGAGLMGALDAIVFHHLLQWHNLYVHAGAFWRSFSDGLLHLATTALLVAGAMLLWHLRHDLSQNRADALALVTGLWLGMGVFQLVDGTLFHLVLKLHPVREGVRDLALYDAAWIGSSLAFLCVTAFLWARLRRLEVLG